MGLQTIGFVGAFQIAPKFQLPVEVGGTPTQQDTHHDGPVVPDAGVVFLRLCVQNSVDFAVFHYDVFEIFCQERWMIMLFLSACTNPQTARTILDGAFPLL